MAIIKCKMCGGDLEINEGLTVAECEYCGTTQTVPTAKDEVLSNLFNRANNLRIKCEFDKAEQIYEKILQQNDKEAEAHWGIILCKYGIEYVEDPKTLKRVPTCHRTSYDAVTADADYLAALQNADVVSRAVYEAEAKAIDEIQKNILNIVKNEKPFDVFICYKETDQGGKRTIDSTIANDIYHQLTQEGLKVFYAAITLEDKLGQEYEPYIFAALNSAKAMLVIGTKPEYFSAVWVKNEWSRYLKLMKTDRSKLLIPCYKDMDAYDLPEEFAHLQAQDMGKIGFINDVVRGIKKVIVKDEPKAETVVKQTIVTESNTNVAPLLKRAFMFLEDGDWNSANEYCEKVLDLDPENARAYLGKLMAELRVKKQESLKDCDVPFDGRNNYQKAIRFADDGLKATLTGYIEHINTRNENARIEGIYNKAKNAMSAANAENGFKEAARIFETISEYKDSAALAKQCYEKAEIARKDALYNDACDVLDDSHVWLGKKTGIKGYEDSIKIFESLNGWKDSEEKIAICRHRIEQIKLQQEQEHLEKQHKAELARIEAKKRAKRNKRIAIIATSVICVVIAFIIVLNTVIIPNGKYNDAIKLMNEGKYTDAITAFEALEGYKDSATKIEDCNTAILDGKYNEAIALMDKGKYDEAMPKFRELNNYKDSDTQLNECRYLKALVAMDDCDYDTAIILFKNLGEYKDSERKIEECNNAIEKRKNEKYIDATALMKAGKYSEALSLFQSLGEYKDSKEKIDELQIKIKDELKIKIKVETLKIVKVGECFTLGKYEQDNNSDNGKEDIEWLVVDIKDGKMLVISKYVLDCKPFNTYNTGVTWETCTLRKWLNNDFYSVAFSEAEKNLIQTATVPAHPNPYGNTNKGNDTQDKIFLLSNVEVETIHYFGLKSRLETRPTESAKQYGVEIDGRGYCDWWLRSPGEAQNTAGYITRYGYTEVNNGGRLVLNPFGVRPAMWIELE